MKYWPYQFMYMTQIAELELKTRKKRAEQNSINMFFESNNCILIIGLCILLHVYQLNIGRPPYATHNRRTTLAAHTSESPHHRSS
jgi:hypothetical protein